MTHYCYNCGSEIDAEALICPYCSARQTKPGDPFIGFFIYHAMNFFGSLPGLIILVFLAWLILSWLF